jgi:hypothetical protein
MNATNNIKIYTLQHISLIISDTSKVIDELTIIQFRLSPIILSQLKRLK